MSMFCNTEGCGKNPLCYDRRYYCEQYRVDRRGNQLPLTLKQRLNIGTEVAGNLVYTTFNAGKYVVINFSGE